MKIKQRGRQKPKITPEQLIEVHTMTNKGCPDGDIAEKTGVSICVVQQRTTKYWADKMARK